MAAGFRRCAASVTVDEAPRGRTLHRLVIELGAYGEVAAVSFVSSPPLPPALEACIVDRVRLAQFPERGDGRAVVELEVVDER